MNALLLVHIERGTLEGLRDGELTEASTDLLRYSCQVRFTLHQFYLEVMFCRRGPPEHVFVLGDLQNFSLKP